MTRLFEARPYIVCEVGSNWQTVEHMVASIGAAKAAGADCVKFQLFDEVALYGFGYSVPSYGAPLKPPFLSPGHLSLLKEKADACGIDFACTAFSPELVAAVDPFVPWHKVASSDATWPQLLEAVAKTGKPIVLSCGAKSTGDIAHALDTIARANIHSPVILLYCVASYPARTVNLVHMTALGSTFKRRYGFSDHTRDIVWAPLSAAMAGATLIEKHFTAFPELDTPDRPHSLTPGEFQYMVETIRGSFKLGLGPTPEEKDMLLRHNRRLVATRDIAPGENLAYGVNYGAYRSLKDDTRGLSPFAWRQVEGMTTLAPIARGEPIGPGDFA